MTLAEADRIEFGTPAEGLACLAELSDVNFVIRMYQLLLLGRMPDGRRLSDYVDQIHRGSISRNQLIRELIASDELRAMHPIFIELSRGRPAVQRECDLHQYGYLRDRSYQVNYSVCLIIGHNGDGGGLSMWVSSRRAGMNVPQMLVAMIDSDQFRKRYEARDMESEGYVVFIDNLFLVAIRMERVFQIIRLSLIKARSAATV